MILVDFQIKHLINVGEFVVTPYDESMVNPCSMDFRLGRRFGEVKPTGKIYATGDDARNLGGRKWIIDPTDKDTFETIWEESDEYLLHPQGFVLAETLEAFEFNTVLAKIAGKSSLGRLGLENSSVAGFIDVGFKCQGITLELVNHGKHPIKLIPGMKIGQLILFKPETPMKDYSITGRYNSQSGNQGSKGV